MIVCICCGVSESRICDELCSGAKSVEELGERCGAGTKCGCCREVLADLIAEELSADAAAA